MPVTDMMIVGMVSSPSDSVVSIRKLSFDTEPANSSLLPKSCNGLDSIAYRAIVKRTDGQICANRLRAFIQSTRQRLAIVSFRYTS